MRYVVITVAVAVVLAAMVLAIMLGAGYFGRAHDDAAAAVTPEDWGEQ